MIFYDQIKKILSICLNDYIMEIIPKFNKHIVISDVQKHLLKSIKLMVYFASELNNTHFVLFEIKNS